MLALTIVPPKPLSSAHNTEGVIDFGVHSGGANKGKHLYIGNSTI
jgi:hypothetical protein